MTAQLTQLLGSKQAMGLGGTVWSGALDAWDFELGGLKLQAAYSSVMTCIAAFGHT